MVSSIDYYFLQAMHLFLTTTFFHFNINLNIWQWFLSLCTRVQKLSLPGKSVGTHSGQKFYPEAFLDNSSSVISFAVQFRVLQLLAVLLAFYDSVDVLSQKVYIFIWVTLK